MTSKTSVFRSAKALQKAIAGSKGLVGFVPTMGALHEGHLALVRRAQKDCERVVVSIFVNPTQFGPGEDFERYPRDLKKDCELLASLGKPVDVFAPEAVEVYPRDFATRILVYGSLGRVLEAGIRPGHFDGVATVVARLFGLVRPDRAYFGLKDYQQFRVIERMTRDLGLPLELVPCATVREQDGLAMSSRNRYLSPAERSLAPGLYRALNATRVALGKGASAAAAEKVGRESLRRNGGFKLQYLCVADPMTLEPWKGTGRKGPKMVLAAAMLGSTRLIDNIKA